MLNWRVGWSSHVLVLFILLLNLALKSAYLGAGSVAGDEPFSIRMSLFAPEVIVRELAKGNNPPLFELILHYWVSAFGIGPTSVRFLPMAFSSLAAMAIFLFGRRYFSSGVAIMATLLFTFSEYQLAYAHESRVYSLFTLLTIWSMHLFLKLAEPKRSVSPVLALVVVNTLLVYAHYFGWWVVAIQVIAVSVFSDLRRNALIAYGLSLLSLLVLYVPNLLVLWQRFITSASEGTWVLPPNGLDSIYTMLWNFSNQPVVTVVCIIILLSGLLYQFYSMAAPLTVQAKVVLLWFLFPFLTMFTLSYLVPMWVDRYLVFVSPAYYLSLAFLLHSMFGNNRVFVAVAAIPVVLFMTTFRPSLDNGRHAREAIAHVQKMTASGLTMVVLCPQWFDLNFMYYHDSDCFADTASDALQNCMSRNNIHSVHHAMQIDTAILAQMSRVIYLDAGSRAVIADNGVITLLQQDFEETTVQHYPDIYDVYTFDRRQTGQGR
jgi:mannosyltransferase